MAAGPTTFANLTPQQFAARLAAVFPPGWCAPEAKMPGGIVYDVMAAESSQLSFVLGSLIYGLDATRIDTAQNGALDAASVDFFGAFPGLYALPRNPGETDASFAARIEAAMLPDGATRQAVSNAIEAVTGTVPRLVEPWQLADTGVMTGGATNPNIIPGPVDTWFQFNTATTPGAIAAPDTTMSGELIAENTTSTASFLAEVGIVKAAASQSLRFFVWLQSGPGRTRAVVGFGDGGVNGLAFVVDLAGGRVGNAPSTFGSGFAVTSAGVEVLGDGWCLCWIVGTTNAVAEVLPFIEIDAGSGTAPIDNTYAGVIGNGIYAWNPVLIATQAAQPGMMFYSVDTLATPGRYSNPGLAYQGFVQTTLPTSQVFGPNPTPCYGVYTMNYSVAGSSMFDPPGSAPLGEQSVYNAINRTKVFGTAVWVQFVPPSGTPAWLPTIVNGVLPTSAANFVAGEYWFNATSTWSSLAAWASAQGGSYSRSGPANYFEAGFVRTAADGVPRFPSNLNGVPTGVRLTGPTTNIYWPSEDVTEWFAVGIASAVNGATAPDQNPSAGTLTENTSNSLHVIVNSGGEIPTIPAGASQTRAIFLKAGTRQYVSFGFSDGAAANYVFSTIDTVNWTQTTGTIDGGAGPVVAGNRLIQLANGWWLATVSGAIPGATQSIGCLGGALNPTDSPVTTYTGTGATIICWGQFCSLLQDWSDYVKTVSGPVTQNADFLLLNPPVMTFSALISTANHTAPGFGGVTLCPLLGSDDTEASRPMTLGQFSGPNSDAIIGSFDNIGSIFYVLSSDFFGPHTSMVAGSPAGRALAVDGVIGSSASDSNPLVGSVINTFYLGSGENDQLFAYGDFATFALWDGVVASNADLVRLT